MKVRVKRLGVAEGLPPSVEVETGVGLTLLGLVEHLGREYGAGVLSELLDGGNLRAGVLALINGRSCEQLGGLDTAIADGDEVFLASMVYGG